MKDEKRERGGNIFRCTARIKELSFIFFFISFFAVGFSLFVSECSFAFHLIPLSSKQTN